MGKLGALDGVRLRGTHSTHFNHKKIYIRNVGVTPCFPVLQMQYTPPNKIEKSVYNNNA